MVPRTLPEPEVSVRYPRDGSRNIPLDRLLLADFEGSVIVLQGAVRVSTNAQQSSYFGIAPGQIELDCGIIRILGGEVFPNRQRLLIVFQGVFETAPAL